MKLFKNKLTVTIIVLSVSFLILVAYSVKREKVSFVEGGASATLSTVQGFFYNVNNDIKDFVGFVFSFSSVKDENQQLKARNSQLEKKALLYDSLKKENDQLRKDLHYEKVNSEYNYIGCEIIGKNAVTKSFELNRGSKDGIAKGMVVVNSDGLIGKISSVASNTSIVDTICSDSVTVAALVKRTNDSSGTVRGYIDNDNSNLVQLTYLQLSSDIKEGDVILTSGMGGGYYPKNIQIGKVTSVQVDSSKVQKTAIIEPYVDFNKLSGVEVVIPNNKSEIKYDDN